MPGYQDDEHSSLQRARSIRTKYTNTGDQEMTTPSLLITGEPAELFAALSAFQGDIESVPKSKSNAFFKSKYSDLAACWDMIRAPLAKHGLTVTQLPVGNEGNLITVLGHKSGAYIQFGHTMKPVKDDPHGRMAANTYNRRACLTSVLGLASDDDDGNTASAKKVVEAAVMTNEQIAKITELLLKYGLESKPILSHFKVDSLADIPPAKYSTVCKQINAKGKKRLAEIPGPDQDEIDDIHQGKV